MKFKNSYIELCQLHLRGRFLAVTFLGFLISTIFLAYLAYRNYSQVTPTLRFLTILHRYGERNPPFIFPTYPYQNELFWQEGQNELMNKGKRTMFEYGKFLRVYYNGFIPQKYKASELYVLSSHKDRCVMSAQALLAGLYPPIADQIWSSDLPWQPIPVYSLPPSIDDLIVMGKPCPLYATEMEAVLHNDMQKILKENKEVIDYLTKVTGQKYTRVSQFAYLYDTLLTTEEEGLPLPEWAPKVYPEILKSFYFKHFESITQTSLMKKLDSGVLINEIITNMKKKRDAKDFDRLLSLYSVHETNIVSLWQSLGVIQELPKTSHGASMIFELHEVDEKFKVKILYKNHAASKAFTILNIKGCGNVETTNDMCDLDTFSSALESVTVLNHEKECNIPRVLQ